MDDSGVVVVVLVGYGPSVGSCVCCVVVAGYLSAIRVSTAHSVSPPEASWLTASSINVFLKRVLWIPRSGLGALVGP